ncbi:MAG: hypothetical protein IJ555_06280 [Ruminococcus sp.]|nr:hypothetical protein [Ruminococcus sp.]
MKKTIMTLVLAALMLAGCASQENGGNTKQADIENIGTAPVSQIWDGYEELQGRQYGNALRCRRRLSRSAWRGFTASEWL